MDIDPEYPEWTIAWTLRHRARTLLEPKAGRVPADVIAKQITGALRMSNWRLIKIQPEQPVPGGPDVMREAVLRRRRLDVKPRGPAGRVAPSLAFATVGNDRPTRQRSFGRFHLALSPEANLQVPEAMLNQWLVARLDFNAHSEFVLCGLVYGHRHLEDGMPVVTSAILEFSDDDSWARTVNTLYRLHEPSLSLAAEEDWKLRVVLFATKRLVASVTLQGVEVRADWPFVRSPAEKFIKPRIN